MFFPSNNVIGAFVLIIAFTPLSEILKEASLENAVKMLQICRIDLISHETDNYYILVLSSRCLYQVACVMPKRYYESTSAIGVLCSYCPNIRDLEIYGAYDGCLPSVHSLNSLGKLYLMNAYMDGATAQSLAELLAEIGSHLHELNLSSFEGCAFWDVLKHCKNLRKLTFDRLLSPPLLKPCDTLLLEPLSRLVDLNLDVFDTIDEDLLVMVLGSCVNVEALTLSRVSKLTDVAVKRIIEVNIASI